MKVKDLKLGDIVKCSDKGIPMYVVGLFRDVAYLDFDGNEGDAWEVEEEDLRPISLTPEILVKNGFHYQLVEKDAIYPRRDWWHWREDKYKSLTCELRKDGWRVSIEDISVGIQDYTFLMKNIKYIHELQHALKLCRIDKEITL